MNLEKKIWIGLTILVILLMGTSFAWWYWNSYENINVSFNVDGITVTYVKGEDITGVNLIPVSTKEKGVNDGTAIEKVVTASSTSTLYMNLNLELEEFPEALQHESLVWEIYNGATLVGSGDFYSAQQGDVIPLATHQEITSTTTSFQLYIWIDGNQDNSESMMNQSFKFVLSAEGDNETRIKPNSPDLDNGLIPVTYNGATWVKADSNNSNNSWYNYDNKQWANAVLVTSDYRDENNNDTFNVGDEVPEDAILAYYVWIPRYKYKVWNVTKTIGTDSYDAQNTGIDVIFENGTETTGTIICNDYDFTITDGSLSEVCSGENGEYYTHPAFTFGEDELRGIWVGKYEISSSTPDTTYGYSSSTTATARIKPNVRSWRGALLNDYSLIIQNMGIIDNEYGLTSNYDSHMIKNIEWGAVAYLTHSGYGRCSDGICSEVGINNYSDSSSGGASSTYLYKTGCGAVAGSASSSTCNEYNTKLGQLASTTGNVYGIYDMNGGTEEFVMGNMSYESGQYTYYVYSAGNNFTYSDTNLKYLTTYSYGVSTNDQTAYNRTRLGDAIGEIILSTGSTGTWGQQKSFFVEMGYPWLSRGGSYSDSTTSGIYYFCSATGHVYADWFSSRATLVSLQ